MNNLTCCFTGHRTVEPSEYPTVKNKLKKTLTSLIEKGYRNFAAGGAIGFDTLAEITVLELKKDYPDIRLHLVLPCHEQEKFWNFKQKIIYKMILKKADSYEFVSEAYTKTCMAQRNRKLVELSSLIVAYHNGSLSGGTAMTVNFAAQKGIEVINLF